MERRSSGAFVGVAGRGVLVLAAALALAACSRLKTPTIGVNLPVKYNTPDGMVLAPSGDIFLFFTDGLSEAMNPESELFGEDRLRAVLEAGESLSTEELKEKILAEVRFFAQGAAQHDDMTLVLLKVI